MTYPVRTLGSNEVSETTMAPMKASQFAVFTRFTPSLHIYHDFFKKDYLNYVSMCGYMHVCGDAQESQRHLISLGVVSSGTI